MSGDAELRESLIRESRAWLQSIIDSTGKTANAIATEAGISASNLHKLLKPGRAAHPLTETTKTKITRALGLSSPTDIKPAKTPAFQEPEGVPYREPTAHPAERDAGNGRDIWVLNGLMIDLDGYLPGDFMMVDMNAVPRKGDIVVAQIYGPGGTAETVFRKYLPPFIVASTTRRETAPDPMLVDDKNVIIMGVVVSSWRNRRIKTA